MWTGLQHHGDRVVVGADAVEVVDRLVLPLHPQRQLRPVRQRTHRELRDAERVERRWDELLGEHRDDDLRGLVPGSGRRILLRHRPRHRSGDERVGRRLVVAHGPDHGGEADRARSDGADRPGGGEQIPPGDGLGHPAS
jgi:hypothetical protein